MGLSAAVLTSLLGFVSPAKDPPPVGAATSIRLHDYNMATIAEAANRNTSRAYLLWAVNSNGSWFVSVNEMCGQDYDFFVANFNPMWSTMVNAKDLDNNCPGITKQYYGNAVFLLGSRAAPGHAAYLSNPNRNCSLATTECRVMICEKVSNYFGLFTGCSSHFQNQNVPLAQTQANEYRYIALANYPTTLRWMGGDFNLLPLQVPGGYYSDHTRLNFSLTVNPLPTGTLNRQFDYIFDRRSGAAHSTIPSFCPNNASDHCLVEADNLI